MISEKNRLLKNDFIILKPDACPHCDKEINPVIINKFPYSFYDFYNIIITYKCPCCEQIFFAKYQINPMAINFTQSRLYPLELIGGHKKRFDFSQEIVKLSTKFVSIYNDAFIAEQLGCDEIVGIAYKRAF